MTITRRDLLVAGGATLATTALPAFAQASPDVRAKATLDAIGEEYLRLSPASATSLGIDTGARAALKGRSADLSRAGRERQAAWLRASVARLRAIDPQGLAPQTQIDIDVARTAYETAIDGMAFGYGDVDVGGWRNGPYVVAQNMGAYQDVPKFLDASHKVTGAADAEAYLARLSSFARNLDGETAMLREARGQGVVASDVLMDKTLSAIRATRAVPTAQWLAVTSLARRTATIPGNWAARAEAIAARDIAPALDRQIAELELHRKAATSDAGVWKFKDGADYYAWALRAATTTRLTPDEIHAQGLAELATYQAKMDTILKRLGMTQGSVGARMTALGQDKRFQFAAGDAGRAEIMTLIQDRVADIRTRMPRGFGTLVRGNVEVKRIALAEEPGAPLAYGGAGTIDGSVPGRFWINLRDPQLHSRFSIPTLTYHEAIPGHVWQGEYAQRLSLLRSLMGFSAMGEGWGLYAEQLAGELGVYDDDPVGRLGYLQSMAFRACRLVVDTGLHAKRWTRAKAIDWFVTTNGSSGREVSSEVDRYCAWPGQACAYKIGHSEINRLRTRAQAQMGSRYDLRAFNDAVITGGGVPLNILDRIVANYAAKP